MLCSSDREGVRSAQRTRETPRAARDPGGGAVGHASGRACSFVAIAEWAADAAPGVLARLGVTGPVPSESTIRRCLQRLAPDELDQLLGAWMWLRTSMIARRRVIAFDGKTLRAACDAAGNLVHLLAGLCQATGTVLAQVAVGSNTNEIPMLGTFLDTIDITDAVSWLRGHWAIESRLHWARDVTYAEDHSQIRAGNGPQVMATLRNTAISLRNIAISILRLDGHDNIAKALRHNAGSPLRPVKLLLT